MECAELAPAVETVHSFPVQPIAPKPPQSLSLKPAPTRDLASQAPPKDWPHAPVHRLSENGVYIVTAGTLHKQHVFDSDAKRDWLESLLLSQAKVYGWDLEAWAGVEHIHWNYDPSTPRGPSMSIRPRPEDCRDWAEAAGFRLLAPGIINLPP